MLGCVTVFGLLLGGICGCGLGLGLLLHWLVPAIDRGYGDALWPCGDRGGPPGFWADHEPLLSRWRPRSSTGLAAAAPAQAGTRGPAPAQAPVTAGREALRAPEGRCPLTAAVRLSLRARVHDAACVV